MRVLSVTPKPESQCIEPTLMLEAIIAFQSRQRIPLDAITTVRTEDRRFLGIARTTTLGDAKLSLDTASESDEKSEQQLTVQLVLPFSPRQLDYIEELRSKHHKRDVVLTCELEVQTLVSKAVNAHLELGPDIQGENGQSGKAVLYRYRSRAEPFSTSYTHMWILSGNGGRTFIERETIRYNATVTISASDWLHDYVSPWRGTRYLVVELPQPDVLISTPGIEEKINAAIEAAKKASGNLAKGEWNDVLEDLRPVWELLRRQDDIKALLERDGYTPEAIKAFNESIHYQFELASKFVHRVGKPPSREVLPEIRASKEDAHLCYSFAMALLNLVSRKAFRQRTSSPW